MLLNLRCWRRLLRFPCCKEIQPVHPKGNQSWIFIGRTDAKTETPILWPPDAKNSFMGKDPDDGKDWGQEEKGMTEDEMFGWHHWHSGHGFGWNLGVGDAQGVVVSCISWGRKELVTIEWLSWTELKALGIPCWMWMRSFLCRVILVVDFFLPLL